MAEPIDLVKNRREILRIQREEFQGHDLIHVRIWFHDDTGELRPSKKGISFKAALAPDLIKALGKVSASDVGAE